MIYVHCQAKIKGPIPSRFYFYYFINKFYKVYMSESIPLCPILRPSFEEFINFEQFVNKVEETYSKQYGMVKIVTPPEWASHCSSYNKILKKLVFQKPEHQTLYCKQNGFAFQCENGKSQQSFTLQDFKTAAATKRKQIAHLTDNDAIEQYFWQTVKNIYKQIYCANVEVSLMDSTSGPWQFEHLQSMFSHAVKEELKGLNTSFLFIGAWKTFFNWHIQDLDLSAINILHEGAPKVWYAVHPQDKKLFETIIKDMFPEKTLSCANFMRHKSIFVNPYKIKEKYPCLRISRMHQLPNEISLAFSQGYHCGFNMGFNIAEAVNYGSRDWLQKLCKFRGCKCPQKVGISIESYQEVVNNLRNSPVYEKIKDTPGFKKIEEKGIQECRQDEQFEKIPKEQIYKEFLKEKTKKINKGLKQIYVPKFKRYFDCQYTMKNEVDLSIECEKCHKWRKASEELIKKYENSIFQCKLIGRQCFVRKNNANKPIKNKKITALRTTRATSKINYA